MRKPIHRKMTHALALECRALVYRMAEKYNIPPVFITAHERSLEADAARVEVWRIMINKMGMTRQLVAHIFDRDRRRMRASVLKKNPRGLLKPKKQRGKSQQVRRPEKRPAMPFQPVGNQFVWIFAVPIVTERPIRLEKFMRTVPTATVEKLPAEEKLRLIRFHEREARMLRKAVRV